MYDFNEYPFTLTVTDAERIASLHDNDENWDFWEFIKLSEWKADYEPTCR